MFIRKFIILILCVVLTIGLFPVKLFAMEPIVKSEELLQNNVIDEDKLDQTLSLGEIGGYLQGNAITAANLFAENKFSQIKGFGFAAERGNNLIDKLKGLRASVVGDNNAANGPDRKIINRDGSITWIQTKYHNSANSSVNDAFDDISKMYRYIDGDGKPMQLEVPSDQYDEAIRLMRKKIEDNLIPGVTNPDEAVNIVRKGNLEYKQAVNIAKAGTIDSLKYDAVNGTITAVSAAGISFLIDYTCCILNGADAENALKTSGLNGLKMGSVVFATYVISSQLAKTGLSNALVPTSESIAKALGENVCEAIVRKAGNSTANITATKAAAKIISKELIVDGVLIVVLTGVDIAELFRGRISTEELLKNLTVTIISIGIGSAGGYGGAVLGTLVAPGLGTYIGAIIGSVVSGGLSAWAAETIIAKFYQSDAEEMFEIISDEFMVLCGEYLINEEEGSSLVDTLSTKLVGDVLKDMYASENRKLFARELLEPLFINEVKKRPEIIMPTEEEIRYVMKSALQGVVFIH